MRPKSWQEFFARCRAAWPAVRIRFDRERRDAWGVLVRRRPHVVESVLEKRGWYQVGMISVERPVRRKEDGPNG